MRTAFFGKGGSGKTTFAAAYTQYIANKEEQVLAIDADHNQHLGETLNIPVTKRIGNHEEDIKDYIKGEREETIISTTPPSKQSQFIHINKENQLLKKYTDSKDTISLLTVGSYEEKDKGATCYHGKLDSLALLLNHLLDEKDDNVVVDGTAGVDTYGSALAAAYDTNILIIEPTEKAITVYKEFEELTRQFHSETYVVVNKVETKHDKTFIQEHIPEEDILGYVKRSKALRRFEQGDREGFNKFINENEDIFKRIKEVVKKQGKNWEGYLNDLKDLHRGAGESWYNNYYNEPISEQANTSFSYKDILHENKS